MSATYEPARIPCKKKLWVGQSGRNAEREMDTMYVYGKDEHLRALSWFFHDHLDHELQFVTSYAFIPGDGGDLGDFTEFEVPDGPVPGI